MLRESEHEMSRRSIWLESSVDLDRLLQIACTECGLGVQVLRGPGPRIVLAPHHARGREAMCVASSAEIRRRIPRLKTWEESRR